ncbi:MAG: hypothetical protein JWP88_1430 [Flaviaesturariibacter sp.]|nr:hypothetical protein [Flaviaesturariibacter sp.]
MVKLVLINNPESYYCESAGMRVALKKAFHYAISSVNTDSYAFGKEHYRHHFIKNLLRSWIISRCAQV